MPPTLALTNRNFEPGEASIVFGWVMVGHQIGAAVAAYGAGVIRQMAGSYAPAFLLSGVFGLVAALAVIAYGRGRQAVAA